MKHESTRGILTLEMLIAMTILIFCLATVVLVSFGNQSILVDTAANVEALDIAQQLLAEERALAEQDFRLVVSTTTSVTIGAIQYDGSVTVTQPDNFTKKVSVEVRYPGEFGRTQNVYLTGLFTNFKSAVGGDSCNSVVGDWANLNPHVVNPETDFATLVGDSSGAYTITDVDAYKKKLYVTVEGTSNATPAHNATVGADDSAVGSVVWNNASNIQTSDDARATAVLNSGESTQYLKATNFGFAIPSGATITGIKVEIERSSSGGATSGITDNAVRILKAGGTIGNANKASVTTWPLIASENGPSNPVVYNPTDLWGEVWSPAGINDPDFGVAISANASAIRTATIDNVRITITYSNKFYVFDIADPTNPTQISSLGSSQVSAGLHAVHVATNSTGSYAYAATNSTTQQFEAIALGMTPPQMIQKSAMPGASGAKGASIFYKNGFVYLGLTNSALGNEFHVIDVHDPSDSFFGTVVDSYEVGGQVNAIYVKDNYAYITTAASEELLVLNVTVPSNIFSVSGFNAPDVVGNGKSLYSVGDALYLGRTVTPITGGPGNPEFYVLDAAVPTAIPVTPLGTKEIGESVNELVFKDYLAFLLTNANLQIFNVHDPENIGSALATLALPSSGSATEPSMDCEGDELYVSANDASNKGKLFVIAP